MIAGSSRLGAFQFPVMFGGAPDGAAVAASDASATQKMAQDVTAEAHALEARHMAVVKAAEKSGDGRYKKNYMANRWEWHSTSQGHQPQYDVPYEVESATGLPLVTSVIWKSGQGWIAVTDVPGPSVIDQHRTKEIVHPDPVHIGRTWGDWFIEVGDNVATYGRLTVLVGLGTLAIIGLGLILPKGR